MFGCYHILAKKSILRALTGLFFIFLPIAVFSATPNDPEYIKQQVMFGQVGAPSAWDTATGSADVVVAVIDTGVDIDHPDLKQNIWVNPKEIAGNGIDDDGNGYADDVNGWNFVENNGNVKAPAADRFGDKETIEHGTVIAGLIGAVGNNGINGSGINWQIKIMPVRAIDSYGSGLYGDIGRAIDYAVANGASVISISFVGDNADDSLKQILRRAYERGVLIVLAVGNSRFEGGSGDLDKNPLYPVCFDSASDNWLMGVTSIDADSHLSGFANFGRCADISAPGEGIFSTERVSYLNGNTGFGGPWQGTSFSVPLVAGAAALIKSVHPDWQAKDLIADLLASADDIDGINPRYVGRMGYGRLNIFQALLKAANGSKIAGGFNRVCYALGARLYCYEPAVNKKLYLANAGSAIIAYDWIGSDYAAALTLSKTGYKVSFFSGDGNLLREWILPSGPKFDRLKFVKKEDSWVVVASGYDLKKKSTAFYEYNIAGQLSALISIDGPLSDWAYDSKGDIVGAVISGGFIKFNIYDAFGKKSGEVTGPPAQSAGEMAVGHFWAGGGEQAAVVLKRNGRSYASVIDISSGSFTRDVLPVSVYPWREIVADDNYDGLFEIFRYNLGGGQFDVVGGKGNPRRSVELPALK